MTSAPLVVSVEPAAGPLWQRRTIRIVHAPPRSLVTLRSVTARDGGDWAAQATFLVGGDGSLDLDVDAPVSGDYRVADAMGLFWAQRREDGTTGGPEPALVDRSLQTTLTAWVEPGTGDADGPSPRGRVSTSIEQWLRAGDVARTDVREHGLVGTLFRPVSVDPLPTVIVMNGSGGGLNEARAAAYASRGIQALALGVFRAPGLSPYISRTPLEYFERALEYVATALDPAGGRPIVSGQSRGGELSLLLAATFPERIAGVAAFVPAAYVFGAQGAADPAEGWSGPTWTSNGAPLQHLWQDNTAVTWQPWSGGPPPSRHRDVYVDAMRDSTLVDAARIPIERFTGPVACVSGLDDRAWPSSMFSRVALDTLARHGHSAERLHLDYEEAGHGITLPHLPSTDIERLHPVSGVPYSNGGTPLGNARASADSFERVTEFIHRVAGNGRVAPHHGRS